MRLNTSSENFLCHSELRKLRIWAYVWKPQTSMLMLRAYAHSPVFLHLLKSLINVTTCICVFACIYICT